MIAVVKIRLSLVIRFALPKPAGLSSSAISSLAQELRRSLGCGSSVEQQSIVLQGDMVDRCKELLQRRGISFVVSGG